MIDMYLINDLTTNMMVAVVDGKVRTIPEAFDDVRHELKSLEESRDRAVACVEMFIKSFKCCTLCANEDCKLSNKNNNCSPVWNGEL